MLRSWSKVVVMGETREEHTVVAEEGVTVVAEEGVTVVAEEGVMVKQEVRTGGREEVSGGILRSRVKVVVMGGTREEAMTVAVMVEIEGEGEGEGATGVKEEVGILPGRTVERKNHLIHEVASGRQRNRCRLSNLPRLLTTLSSLVRTAPLRQRVELLPPPIKCPLPRALNLHSLRYLRPWTLQPSPRIHNNLMWRKPIPPCL